MKTAWNITSALSLAALLALAVRDAHAEPVLFDCPSLSAAIGNMADFRDTGAKLELVLQMALERNRGTSRPHQAVVEREIRRLWREGLRRDEAAASAFKRCRAQLGDMGRDI